MLDIIFEENPSMNQVYPGESRNILEVFKTPIVRKTFSFGNYQVNNKGFLITDGCIECGQCAIKCPQNCIVSGNPYEIMAQHCLHCGLCRKTCPVDAIERRN